MVAIGATAGAAAGAYVTPIVTLTTLNAVGFTTTGVAAGSMAASMMGPATAAGSFFAMAQSAGAMAAVGIACPVIGAVTCAGIGAAAAFRRWRTTQRRAATADTA